MTRERGFALLIVLWTLALLALVVAQFTKSGRTEVQVSANLRANAVTQAAADGALHEAILRLLQRAWLPDGRMHVLRVGDSTIEVRIVNQGSKVNPNAAPMPVMQALLRSLGADAGKAADLSRAIIDWRTTGPRSLLGGSKLAQYQAAGLPYGPGNQPFDSLDEMGLVLGATPALLARLHPLLSVYQEGDAAAAGDPMLNTTENLSPIDDDGWHFGATGRVMVVMVEAAAASAQGGRFTRKAVVRLRAEASLDQAPYQILTWDTQSE